MSQEFEETIQNLKSEKHTRVTDLNNQLLLEKENMEKCRDRVRQMSEYVQSAKKLLRLKKERSPDRASNFSIDEDNLLKSMKDIDINETQNIYNLESTKEIRKKASEAYYLESNLKKIESNIYKNEISQLKNEIMALLKDTKIAFTVIDKILPRDNHDPIHSLLEFEEKGTMTFEDEIDDFLCDDTGEGEVSLRKAIKSVKLIRSNIIKLKNKGFEIL